jgi:hypothetical protein
MDDHSTAMDRGLSWTERLRAIKAQASASKENPRPRVGDPWEPIFVALKGTEQEGFERVPTYLVFDHLGVRRSERSAGAARRLARVMGYLGWRRCRFCVGRGSHQRVRGFERASPGM